MTRYDIYQKKSASVYANRWRDCTPLGNGYTGIALYGGVATETIAISRADLWYGAYENGVPDVLHVLGEMRSLQKKGKMEDACSKMYDALNDAGYNVGVDNPRVLGCVRIQFACKGVYSKYRRITHTDTAESEIQYRIDDISFNRRCFVSRKRDLIVMRIQGTEPSDLSLSQGFFDSFEGEREREIKKSDAEYALYTSQDNCMIYSSKSEEKFFGIVTKAFSDGNVEVSDKEIQITQAKDTLIIIKVFSNKSDRKSAERAAVREVNNCINDYQQLFFENLKLYGKLYKKADVKLYTGRKFHSNEELLADAMDNECSQELIEKLWRFGRYLFISGVTEKGLPFPLYGLWSCGYERIWAQHVGNENVQMIHWHAVVGGLSNLIEPLINFYYSKIEGFRECAKNLFGCRGIFAGVYLAPNISLVTPHVPVILHFLGVAGWISRHFYEYYMCTKDERMFQDKILPFMIETVKFYEDYVYEDENGKIELYPACSPENTPLEYKNAKPTITGHEMPVTKNPTIEFAILKELLINLLEISDTHPELNAQAEKWKEMLSKIPDYMINESGAIAEWMDESVHDYYSHRHLSHIYPIFPGTEIEDTERYDLLPAFKKAVDMRELGHMTGWSLMHMAAIYARLREKEKVFNCFNMLCKVCLLDNFFTLHNDYRQMGITAVDMGNEIFAPVQLDAIMGAVNAVQEMLIYASAKTVKLLPACSERFAKGSANLCFFDGTVKLKWDLKKQFYRAQFKAIRDTNFRLELPFGQGSERLNLKSGEIRVFENI